MPEGTEGYAGKACTACFRCIRTKIMVDKQAASKVSASMRQAVLVDRPMEVIEKPFLNSVGHSEGFVGNSRKT